MSVKGITKELFIGKEEINIITFMGNKITVPYSVMTRIDFCFASKYKKGFMNFIEAEGNINQFNFGNSANEKMEQTVNFIKERYPNLELKQIDISEFKNNRTASFVPIFGHKELGLLPLMVSIHQHTDGTVYFNSDTKRSYFLTDYEWSGPEYDVVTNSTTKASGKSTTKKRGKSLKIGVGALIGSALGPEGTLAGAAMGAGSKGVEKTKGNSTSKTQQKQSNVEKSTSAIITLVNSDTKKEYKLTFKCDSKLDAKMRCFNINPVETKQNIVDDVEKSLDGIKALKELFDLGMISQEEFDKKKKQLFN